MKRIYPQENNSIQKIHKTITSLLQKEKEYIEDCCIMLSDVQNMISFCKSVKISIPHITSNYDRLLSLENELIEKIDALEKDKDFTSYTLATSHIWMTESESTEKKRELQKEIDRAGILSFFPKHITKNNEKKRSEFLYLVGHYLYPKKYKKNNPLRVEDIEDEFVCKICNSNLIILRSEALLLCKPCGTTIPYAENSSRMINFGERYQKLSVSGYKRKNHFSEWLTQTQAREGTKIEEKILNEVRNEFLKRKKDIVKDCSASRVGKYLKSLGYTTYYEHKNQIAYELSGIEPIQFTTEQKDKLHRMFHLCQNPFDTCPDKYKKDNLTGKIRTNFPSYSFTLYKFCELLGYDHLLHKFKKLKSINKLAQHDKIWKYFCECNGWEYIPSSCYVP